jgi:hypothetical protein
VLGGEHVGVHAAITESKQMIERLKQESVSSVDCEAGFIAEAIKGSGMSLYHFVRLSDVPDTEQSIGMGGIASAGNKTGGAGKDKGPPKVSQLDVVVEILKNLLGTEITQGQDVVGAQAYPIERASGSVVGEIHGLQLDPPSGSSAAMPGAEDTLSTDDTIHDPGDPSLAATSEPIAAGSSGATASTSAAKGKAKASSKSQAVDEPRAPGTEPSLTAFLSVLLAPVGEGYKQDVAGILALFSRKVSGILEAEHGVVNLSTMNQVNHLVQDFYSLHKIKIEVRFEGAK